jgi:SAM-dependent methyltransferase
MERHRLLWLHLQNNPALLEGDLDILHIAPEYVLKRRLSRASNLNYITGDLGAPLADLKLDVQDMPFANESFDVVFCNHVLEHVDDDRQAMREIYRVLRPEGWALLMCPLGRKLDITIEDPHTRTPTARLANYGQEDHVRLYGSDYFDRLREAGFVIETLRVEDVASGNAIETHKLRRDTDLFREDELIICRPAPIDG